MSEETIHEKVISIQQMKENGCLKNYIEYIQFPFYKNLVRNTRINFTFPMPVLIGKIVVGKVQHYMHYLELHKDIHVEIFCSQQKLIQMLKVVIKTDIFMDTRIFMMLDGDMETGYIFDEKKLTKEQLENSKYLANCVKSAFGMELDVYPDGGRGGKREDQQCEEYLNYLRYYSTNVFYLPDKKMPEENFLESRIVKERFGDILEKYKDINHENAKDIVRDI